MLLLLCYYYYVTRRRLGLYETIHHPRHAVLKLCSLSKIEYGAVFNAQERTQRAMCRAMRASRLAASAPRRQLQGLRRPFIIGRDRDNDVVGLHLQIGAWNEILDGENCVRSQLVASRTQTVRQGTGGVRRGLGWRTKNSFSSWTALSSPMKLTWQQFFSSNWNSQSARPSDGFIENCCEARWHGGVAGWWCGFERAGTAYHLHEVLGYVLVEGGGEEHIRAELLTLGAEKVQVLLRERGAAPRDVRLGADADFRVGTAGPPATVDVGRLISGAEGAHQGLVELAREHLRRHTASHTATATATVCGMGAPLRPLTAGLGRLGGSG